MKKKREEPLTKLADAAFERAALKVIKRAEESGTPVIVWKDETIKQLTPRNAPKHNKSTQNHE